MLREVIEEGGGIVAFLRELAAFGLIMFALLAIAVVGWGAL